MWSGFLLCIAIVLSREEGKCAVGLHNFVNWRGIVAL
jgi:hypothetical protein